MAPVTTHYEYLVIGGGSGGVASARRAAQHGAKALVIEGKHLGGTCVNVGCVPKKVMWNASDLATRINHHASGYNMSVGPAKFDWPAFKAKRDAYIERLRGIYERNLSNEKVDFVYGWASLVDKNTVKVNLNDGTNATYTADKILITAGGEPTLPKGIPGAEHGVTSDGFFELETQPERVAIVGAGYIGVELAGVFNGLGTKTHLVIRGETVLRNFDDLIQNEITNTYEKHGINVHKFSQVSSVKKLDSGALELTIKTEGKPDSTLEVDALVWAIGRKPLSEKLGLSDVGITQDKRGKIVVDEYQNTNIDNIFSIGDIAEDVELTPAAIAAGRKLGDRLFGGIKDAKLDYTNIPSAIFSHPEAGSVGLSEKKAREQYGDAEIKVYKSRFINMYYSPLAQEDKDFTAYKIVCAGKDEKVVGLHLVGDSSAEILQGFGVAIKMGATKKDFDSCVAIHPTAAEELVTMK